jgi:WD40 repeat protein/tRNA A-37 threonylcarbamoyl transferase component Bud32
MSTATFDRFSELPRDDKYAIDELCTRFEDAWQSGQAPRLETFLEGTSATGRAALLGELLAIELEYRRKLGERPGVEEYARRFTGYGPIVRQVFVESPETTPADDGRTESSTRDRRVGGDDGLPHVPGYEVVARIGQGGMGVVYKARDAKLKRLVALKMVLAADFARPVQMTRFLIEGEMLARLHHPNIVQVHEVGQYENKPFLVLEYVEGGTLAEALVERMAAPREAAELVERLARAVHYAHLQGVIHRDLKPANVLLPRAASAAGLAGLEPKLADFGLARSLDRTQVLTESGVVAGTPSYMAPELALGDKPPGPAVDVYALGALLYEMLAGRPPFLADTPLATLRAALETEPARPSLARPGLSPDLETICLKCLEKEPARRYPSAEALAEDLSCWLAGKPITARPVHTIERLWKWSRRRPALASLATVLAVVIVGVSLGSALAARNFKLERDKALQATADAKRREQAERWERYRANILSATGALQLNQAGTAEEALEGAPREHRNWEWFHLRSQLDRASEVLPAYRLPSINRWEVPVSADGRQVLFCDDSVRRLHLWDLAAGSETATLPVADTVDSLAGRGDGGQFAIAWTRGGARLWQPGLRPATLDLGPAPHIVCDFQYSPDGRRLLSRACSGGSDTSGKYWLWDTATGRQVAVIGSPATPCLAACFSPDSRRLAAGRGHELWLWDAATGRALTLLGRARHDVVRVAFSPDGRLLASRSDEETSVHVWDVSVGPIREVALLAGHTVPAKVLAFSPDGARLATGGEFPDNSVRLWDPSTGKLIRQLTGHRNFIEKLVFRSDGHRLASFSRFDHTGRLWDGQTGQAVALLRGHTGTVTHVAFNPDGSRCVTSSMDHTLRLWNAENGELVTVLRGHGGEVMGFAFAAGGQRLVSASTDRTHRVWDLDFLEHSVGLRGHGRDVYDVAFRPDGRQIASCSWDQTARLWDLGTGRHTAALPLGHNGSGCAFSPDGRQLATITMDNRLALWDVATATKTHESILGRHEFWSVPHRPAYNRSGTLLATPTDKGRIALWDPRKARILAVLQGSDTFFTDLTFDREGARLCAGGNDGRIHVWDVATRRPIGAFSSQRPAVYRLALSPDGRQLAFGCLDQTVRLCDMESLGESAALRCDSNPYGLAFLPDGTRLAIGCADNVIRLWDVTRVQKIAELHGHEAFVHALAFSPDGSRLASASGDATIGLWDTLTPAKRKERQALHDPQR